MRGTVAKRIRRQAALLFGSLPPSATMNGTRKGRPASIRLIYRAMKDTYKGNFGHKDNHMAQVDAPAQSLEQLTDIALKSRAYIGRRK